MFTPENILPLVIILPLVAAVLIRLTGESNPNLREGITIVTSVVLLLLLLDLAPVVMEGGRPTFFIAEPFPGIPLQLTLEPLGMLFALVAGILWIITSIYAIGYMRGHHEENQTRFFMFFAIAISVTMGVTFSGNLLTLFVFYEALTLSTYPLVTHAGTDDARRAGRVYMGILLSTSIVFLLLAIIWTWWLAGTLDFRTGGILAGTASEYLLSGLLLLFFFGVGKAALMPFHRWLPAAMVAPTPVSALLHAVAVVKAGVFSLLKVAVYVFGIDTLYTLPGREWLLIVIAASILLASLTAMRKDNLKARLAYSTISQLGYITLGAALATSAGIIGGAMHIVMHAFAKITLFFAAGAILVAAHKTEISQLNGLGRRMPLTFAAFTIGSLSIIGLPPFGGMWSKWYLAMGTLEAEQLLLLATLMISSLLNIAYLLPIPLRAFFGSSGDADKGIKEAPVNCLIAMIVTSVACLILFLYPQPWFRMASLIAY
ncbi:MAG: proton-conducting transporter membrane subunit [Pseudohongiellaceae bacterium]